MENENLEEDMRKAKESADMLRSVVLPLETEISSLRSRSSTSEKRIKELEKIIDDVYNINKNFNK
jgi:Rab GTPase-binding effector protein 1